MKRERRRRLDIDLKKLDDIVESARERALEEDEHRTLRTAIHAMAAALIPQPRSTEKTAEVVEPAASAEAEKPEKAQKPPAPGHGRNGAAAYPGARRVPVAYPGLAPGCVCPDCQRGKVYPSRRNGPGILLRFVGQPLVQGTLYELESLRCNLCQKVFTAPPPEGVGDKKYDETVVSGVAVAKYGDGIPFNRLESMQRRHGIPLPASTQWELVEEAAHALKPVFEELVRQAARGHLVQNDDTNMRILKVQRAEGDKRTGTFTTAVVAEVEDSSGPGGEEASPTSDGGAALASPGPPARAATEPGGEGGEAGALVEPGAGAAGAGAPPEPATSGAEASEPHSSCADATAGAAPQPSEAGVHVPRGSGWVAGKGAQGPPARLPGHLPPQGQKHRIAVFFTGTKHAGENLADLLLQRPEGLPPVTQMCDALSRNVPRLAPGVQLLLAHCLAHGRRHFVDQVESFPDECRHVLEMLGEVYGYDEEARQLGLDPHQRLRFHQEHSGPVMKDLHEWLTRQLAERLVEPNSGLGKAIQYLLTHWKPLTLFLRHPGAPLDNNTCERALKKAVLHRKNALFYRTLNGAQVGDLYMTLIHTCELCGANAFDYLTELQRHPAELLANPAAWMPWNYKTQLTRAGPG